MHLDWIVENEHNKGEARDVRTQRLIRRRATQAAVLTRYRERATAGSIPQSQSVQDWVVNDSFCRSGSVFYQMPLQAGKRKTPTEIAVRAAMTVSVDLPPSNGAVLRDIVARLQCAESQQYTLQKLMSQSAHDNHHVRFFVAVALTDTDYLHSVASLYGRSGCLDIAIDCLASCLQELLAGNVGRFKPRRLYLQAVRVLQSTLATNFFSERFEIYYAIPLLVLFELLNAPAENSYLTHGRGAIYLLHFIGPEAMSSHINKLLLAMQSDMMVVENLRDGHVHCCATLQWHRALLQAIDEDLPPGDIRSRANVTLNIIATALPHVFSSVEDLVHGLYNHNDGTVLEHLDMIMDQLQIWQQDWESSLSADPGGDGQSSVRTVLFTVFLMYKALVTRLAVAPPQSLAQRLFTERKALAAASTVIHLAAKVKTLDVTGQTRLNLVMQIVLSVIETNDEWQQTIKQTLDHLPIDQIVFSTWTQRIGRRHRTAANELSVLPGS